MSAIQLVGVVVLVLGVVVLGLGINAANSLTEQVVEGLTGRFTERTTWYILAGIAMIVAGLALALFGRQRRT